MGWIFSIALLVVGISQSDGAAIIASGIFAVAGAVTIGLRRLEKVIDVETKKSV